MAQVAEITFGQKVMEKETEKRISEIEGKRAEIPAPPPQTPPCSGPGGLSFALPSLFSGVTGSLEHPSFSVL